MNSTTVDLDLNVKILKDLITARAFLDLMLQQKANVKVCGIVKFKLKV